MKAKIRALCKEKRNNVSDNEVIEKSRLAAELFLSSKLYLNSECIMLYMPLGNETDTSLILEKALADGKRVVIPVTDIVNTDIIPCVVTKETDFQKGAYSINEPDRLIKADETHIDTVIVPGIAFGKDGARVGFGKGYYDRFLQKTNAIKVGFCYEFQLYETIPADSHDMPMDYVITENIIYKTK